MEQPLELLLVASECKDPYSTVIVNPKSCVACWSYKGSELQGAEIGCVEMVGHKGDLLLIAAKDRPLTHVIAVNGRDRFHIKSLLTKPLQCVTISKDGAIIFGGIESRVFTWMVATGALLSVIDAHYQNITCLCLSSDDGLLFTGAVDGTINVYLVSELLSWNPGGLEIINPFRQWHVHSLAITNLSVTCLANPRVISSSLDHTAALHSVTMDECLLKISGDRPITASCIDPAETAVFLGTDEGPIIRFPLYSIEGRSERLINYNESNSPDGFFMGHTFEVTRITLNHDASLLASGDRSGVYIVWDAVSRQCLKSVQMKGSVCKLQFIEHWESIRQADYPKINIPVGVLQRSRVDNFESMKIHLCGNVFATDHANEFVCDHLSKCLEKQLELLRRSSESRSSQTIVDNNGLAMNNPDDDVLLVVNNSIGSEGQSNLESDASDPPVDSQESEIVDLRVKNTELSAQVKKLKAELLFARKKNQEIFEFASELVLEKKRE